MGLIDKVNVEVNGSGDLLSTLSTYTTKILKPNIVDGKNILTQAMVSSKNTKYVIKYDYELEEDITIPEGCLIEFDGGSFSNGTLVGNETILVYNQEEEDVFKNVSLEGSFERSTSAIADKMDNTNGMAKIYLKKNKPLATQLTQPNTIYVIQYDFTLGGDITVPANCVLEFDGGSINGAYTVTGTNTGISAGLVKIFGTDVTLAGSYTNGVYNAEWFGCNTLSNNNETYINNAIKCLNNIGGGTLLINNDYTLSDTIILRENVSLQGTKKSKRSAVWYPRAKTVLKFLFTNKNKWMVDTFNSVQDTYDYNILSLPDDNIHADLVSISIKNLSFVNGSDRYTDAIFGGMRFGSFQGSIIDEVQISGVKYGIAFAWSWTSSLSNVSICSTGIGVFVGETCTTLSAQNLNITCHSSVYNGVIDNELLSNDLFPPYATIESSAIVIDNISNSYTSTISFNQCEFEKYDAICLLRKGSAIFEECYFERIRKTLVWATEYSYCMFNGNKNTKDYGLDVFINNSSVYEFGAGVNSVINAKRITLSRCYPDGAGCYFIEPIGQRTLLYDKFTYNGQYNQEDISVVDNLVIAKRKTILGNYNVFNCTTKNKAKTSTLSIDGRLNIANGLYSSDIDNIINFMTYMNIKKATINAIYDDVFVGIENVIADKNLKIVGNRNFYIGSNALAIDNTTLDLSEVVLQTGALTDDHIFDVSNNCTLIIGAGGYNTKTGIINLQGTDKVNVSLYATSGIYPYIESKILYNSNFTYPYKIFIYVDNVLTKVITNSVRPTNGLTVGDIFIENGSPIFWNGTAWVDATGATV